jgi:CHASE3 domain sensor protein
MTHMPVSAFWWLQDYLDERGIDASVSGIHDDRGQEIMNELDSVVAEVLTEEFGRSDTEAARRWQKAGLV